MLMHLYKYVTIYSLVFLWQFTMFKFELLCMFRSELELSAYVSKLINYEKTQSLIVSHKLVIYMYMYSNIPCFSVPVYFSLKIE